MSRKNTKTLFYKYFFSYLTIIISAIVIMLTLVFYMVLSYTETQTDMYRTRMEDQINQMVSVSADACTNIFYKISALPSLSSFFYSDLEDLSELELYKRSETIKTVLSSFMTNESYVDSAYIYSTANNVVISNKTLKTSANPEDYLWYTNEFNSETPSELFRSGIIEDTASAGSYTAVCKRIMSTDKGNVWAIVLLNLSMMKRDAAAICTNSNGSFMLYDLVTSSPITSTSDEDFSKALSETSTNKNTKLLFNRNSYNSYPISEYNWKCLYKYDNYATLKNAYHSIFLLMPLLIVIIILTALIISYLCAKQIYHPINSLVSVINDKIPDKSDFDEETEHEYLEIKYITQTLLKTLNDKHRLQEELEDKLTQMNDLKRYALLAQIQPHLIFNTLEIIYLESYNLLGDDNIVSEMVCSLADIVRLSIKDEHKFFSIADELLHVQKYIHIQSIRFEDIFETVWETDNSLNEFLTPKIILQPIIENSIVHGIIPSNRFCTLKIKSLSDNDDIVFLIEDNGMGMSRARLDLINSYLKSNELPEKNIGIANVHLRIKILFGEKYGCSILKSDNTGTITQIKIPKITA